MKQLHSIVFGALVLSACAVAPGDEDPAASEDLGQAQEPAIITVNRGSVPVTLRYEPGGCGQGYLRVTADSYKWDAEWTFDFYQDGEKVYSSVSDYSDCDPQDILCDKPTLKVPVGSVRANFQVVLKGLTQSIFINAKYNGTSNLVAVRDFCAPASTRPEYAWSSAGPIGGMFCTNVNEGADPHTWADNYFCSFDDVGLQFSGAGPIAGKTCTSVDEPGDPHTWRDNYICSNGVSFRWSYDGPPNGSCVQWSESADPDGWDDNYLCY